MNMLDAALDYAGRASVLALYANCRSGVKGA